MTIQKLVVKNELVFTFIGPYLSYITDMAKVRPFNLFLRTLDPFYYFEKQTI